MFFVFVFYVESTRIENTVFSDFSQTPVKYSDVSIKLEIDFCVFDNCNSGTDNGGAILFTSSSSGSILITKVCGYGCCSKNGFGQFGYMNVKPSYSNSASLLSVSRSSPLHNTGYHSAICFYDGNQVINSINVSYCSPNYWSAIGFGYSKNSVFSYSHVFSTYTTGYLCVIYSYGGSFNTNNVNFVNNSQDSTLYGMITETWDSISSMVSCVFVANTNSNNRCLFYAQTGSILLSECNIQTGITIYRVDTNNNYGPTSVPFYQLYSSHKCQNEYITKTQKNPTFLYNILVCNLIVQI